MFHKFFITGCQWRQWPLRPLQLNPREVPWPPRPNGPHPHLDVTCLAQGLKTYCFGKKLMSDIFPKVNYPTKNLMEYDIVESIKWTLNMYTFFHYYWEGGQPNVYRAYKSISYICSCISFPHTPCVYFLFQQLNKHEWQSGFPFCGLRMMLQLCPDCFLQEHISSPRHGFWWIWAHTTRWLLHCHPPKMEKKTCCQLFWPFINDKWT